MKSIQDMMNSQDEERDRVEAEKMFADFKSSKEVIL